MKQVFLCLICAVLCLAGSAQGKIISLNAGDLTQPRSFTKGDVLRVQADSILVFDTQRHNRSVAAMNAIIRQSALIRQQFDSCMRYSSESAAKLSAVTFSLAGSLARAADSSSVMLRETRQNLDAAANSLNAANAGLKAVETILQQERAARRKRSLAWGLGGFGVGLLTASTIVLLMGR